MDKWASTVQKKENAVNETNTDSKARSDSSVFEREIFMENLMEDIDLARHIIDIFLKDAPEQLRSLKRAIEEEDMPGLGSCAHRLKGSSANIGGISLSNSASKVEAAAMSGEHDDINVLVSELEEQFKLLVDELKRF